MKGSGSSCARNLVAKQPTTKARKKAKTTDDPQIPQPDLRFAKGNNSEARNKRGRGPTQTKTTHDLPQDTGGISHCVKKR